MGAVVSGSGVVGDVRDGVRGGVECDGMRRGMVAGVCVVGGPIRDVAVVARGAVGVESGVEDEDG